MRRSDTALVLGSVARSRILGLAAAAILGACGGRPTEVVVRIDAQPGARAAARSLQVRVIGTDGAPRLDETRAIDATTAWPLRLPLVPEGGDASRRWAVEATLTDEGGAVVAIARARGGYVAGAIRESLLCLYDGCADEPCGATEPGCAAGGTCETCRSAACGDATATLDAHGSAPRCPIGSCVPRSFTETACSDGIDDDCDGRIDCLDAQCDCDGGACTPTRTEDTLAACHDGTDDDCDGLVDCAEGGVCIFAEGPDGCDNGLDDDCDGLVDCLDPACCAAPACDQRSCGGAGLFCCAGACVNTFTSETHCGACGIACASGRVCNRVPRADGTPGGAACRCAVGAGECAPGFVCESHDGASFCNCPGDLRCIGRAVCQMQGDAHHSYCTFP